MPSSDDVHIIWLISSVHAFKKIFHSQELPREYLPIHLQQPQHQKAFDSTSALGIPEK